MNFISSFRISCPMTVKCQSCMLEFFEKNPRLRWLLFYIFLIIPIVDYLEFTWFPWSAMLLAMGYWYYAWSWSLSFFSGSWSCSSLTEQWILHLVSVLFCTTVLFLFLVWLTIWSWHLSTCYCFILIIFYYFSPCLASTQGSGQVSRLELGHYINMICLCESYIWIFPRSFCWLFACRFRISR
jgi:hypothetical protein